MGKISSKDLKDSLKNNVLKLEIILLDFEDFESFVLMLMSLNYTIGVCC